MLTRAFSSLYVIAPSAIALACAACGGIATSNLNGDGGSDSTASSKEGGGGHVLKDGGGSSSPDAHGFPDVLTAEDPAMPPPRNEAGSGDTGAPNGDTGVANGDTGVPNGDTGLPNGDSGIPNGDSGAPPPVDAGAGCPADPTGDCTLLHTTCSYPTETCQCTYGAPPTSMAHWDCTPLAAGCPVTPPTVGSTCTAPGIDCDYGHCTGGEDVTCTAGRWANAGGGCPGH